MDKIDISRLATKWNILQKICIATVFLFFHNVAINAADFLRAQWSPDDEFAINYSFTWLDAAWLLCLGFIAQRAWSNSASADSEALVRLRSTYRIALGVSVVAVLFVIWLASTLDEDDGGTAGSSIAFIAMALGFYIVSLLVVLWMIRSIFRQKIEGLGVSFGVIADAMKTYAMPAPAGAQWHIRMDRPLGFVWFGVGGILFLVGATIISYLYEHVGEGGSNGATANIALGIEVFGMWCIFHGRSFFVPDAEAALAMDKRAPILYLRSFADDEELRLQAGAAGGISFDRTLEMKLAKHFHPFGPLVAIGSPRDKVPKLGAIRLVRSDEDWQATVSGLMADSRWIVASVGKSHWVQWEIGELMVRGLLDKTVLVLPAGAAGPFAGRGKAARTDNQGRIATLAAVLAPQGGIGEERVGKKEFLLGCVVRGGKALLVVGRNPKANTQFLAAIIGHYLLKEGRKAA